MPDATLDRIVVAIGDWHADRLTNLEAFAEISAAVAALRPVLVAARAVVDTADSASIAGDPNPVGRECADLRDALAAADGAQ